MEIKVKGGVIICDAELAEKLLNKPTELTQEREKENAQENVSPVRKPARTAKKAK